MLSLALVDGAHGISYVLESPYEYLRTARRVTDVHQLLQEYVSRIPYDSAPKPNWPVHVAGHPPGALLFFIGLDRIGLGGGLAAGMVVTVLAATTAVAVLVCVRVLGDEPMARRAAPFLVFAPAAVWQAVSADAMFAAVAAWALAALALAATRRSVGWSLAAGLLLGACVMLSYGLPLLGILALTVLALGRSWFPLPIAAAAALAVVVAFALLGFSYLDALPALHERYLAGVGGRRPAAYWTWGALAALAFSAGRWRRRRRRPASSRPPRPVDARDRRARGRGPRVRAGGRRDPAQQGGGRADLAALRALDPAQLRAAARALAPPRTRAAARGRARRRAPPQDRLVIQPPSSKRDTASSSHAMPVPGVSGTVTWPSRTVTGCSSSGPARSRCSSRWADGVAASRCALISG